MKKIIKFGLMGVGGFVALFALIAAYFAATFNPNDYKPMIVKLVKEKKERTLNIEGDIKLSFWPKIGADLGKVSISEHKGRQEFASVQNAKVALAVLPLLKKELVVDTVYIDGAKANIVKHKDGSTNFDDLISKDDEESQQIKFDVDGVNVKNSQVTYTDEGAGAVYQVADFNMQSGALALKKPFDLKADFKLNANQPKVASENHIKGRFMLDPEAKHFVVENLDANVKGDLAGGKNVVLTAKGDVNAKPSTMEFLVDDLAVNLTGEFAGAKQNVSLNAPSLKVKKDAVSSKKVSLNVEQEKAGEHLKANVVLADVKGSPRALESSGVTGDIDLTQGKRTVTGQFSSPFAGNLEALIFDLPKLAGHVAIKDPSLPNGAAKGDLALKLHADVKKQLIDSQFNLNVDQSKLNGNVAVANFKTPNIQFNLNADTLDLNKLIGKSPASAKPSSNQPADLSALKTLLLEGKVNVGAVLYDKYRLSGLNVGIKADGQKLDLTGLNVKFDDSKINGSLGISQFAKPLYHFDLTVDAVDLDKYVSPSKAPAKETSSAGAPDLSALKALNADGNIRVGSLKYGKTKASNVDIHLKADGEKISLAPLSVKVDDSQIKGSFAIAQLSRPKYLFDLDIDQLDANKYTAGGSASSAPKSNQPADLTALKSVLADGSLRIGSLKFDRYQITNLKAGLKADGQQLQLNPLIAKVDDSQINANLGVSQFSRPAYHFDVNIDRLDVDRYVAKGGTQAKNGGDAPLDLSVLKALNATGNAKVGWLKIANVKTESVHVGLKAADGVATLSPFSANLYQGNMDGMLKVDARSTPSIAFKQNMKSISIGPLLVDAMNNDMLSGSGTLNVDVTTQGATVGALKKGLQGNASLNLADGALKGVDIAGSIRELKSKVNFLKTKEAGADKTKKTDFSELTATFNIKNGVAHNEDLAMKAPILRLAKGDSRGDIDIGNERIQYIAKPTIVKSLKGQGGAELDSLSGLGVPIKISGTFADPKYGLDFSALGTALAQSALLEKVGGEKGAAVKEMLGSDNKLDALKGLLSKKKDPAVDTVVAPPTEGASVAPPSAEPPKSVEDQAKDQAKEKLKKLLKF